jgi:hypothetical protein
LCDIAIAFHIAATTRAIQWRFRAFRSTLFFDRGSLAAIAAGRNVWWIIQH